MYAVGSTGFCTHGPDPVRPGAAKVDANRSAGAPTGNAIICDGDGTSGKRVEVMYVRNQSHADRYATFLSQFKQLAVDVDLEYNASAAETGGSRNLRFVTSGCDLVVHNVVVPDSVSSFDDSIGALVDEGYDHTDRKYLMWFDKANSDICGIGTYWGDDRSSLNNWSNTTSGYARVDADCWDYPSVTAHEIMHTLGAVNASAPNSTDRDPHSGGGHCTDEYDIMCYKDAPGVQTFVVCSNQSHDDRLDCNHDDYYSTNPAPGSYLDTHWNTANSGWLITGTPTGDTLRPSCGPWRKQGKTTLTASVSDAQSGLATVTVVKAANMNVTHPSFVPGSTAPITVTATKIKKSKRASVNIEVADVAGNTTRCAQGLR